MNHIWDHTNTSPFILEYLKYEIMLSDTCTQLEADNMTYLLRHSNIWEFKKSWYLFNITLKIPYSYTSKFMKRT